MQKWVRYTSFDIYSASIHSHFHALIKHIFIHCVRRWWKYSMWASICYGQMFRQTQYGLLFTNTCIFRKNSLTFHPQMIPIKNKSSALLYLFTELIDEWYTIECEIRWIFLFFVLWNSFLFVCFNIKYLKSITKIILRSKKYDTKFLCRNENYIHNKKKTKIRQNFTLCGIPYESKTFRYYDYFNTYSNKDEIFKK